MTPKDEARELKECPFCGNEAQIKTGGIHNEYFHIRCKGGCVEQQEATTDKELAIKAWNTRSDTRPQKAVLDEGEIASVVNEYLNWEKTHNEIVDDISKAIVSKFHPSENVMEKGKQ